MNIFKTAVAACVVIVLSGCASQSVVKRYSTCSGKSFNQLLEATELKPLFNDIARELCSEPCVNEDGTPTETRSKCSSGNDSTDYSVLITDFVDIQSFAPASQGLLMGELMRGSLSSVCSTKITQVEFAKFFNLNERGLVVLSRKVSEIKKDEYDQTEAVVGTYSYLNNKIVIFVRKINVVSGKISRMVTREIDYNCAGGTVSYSVK
ncbi:MAG: FlgO family outer membrane protein [Desulfuromonadaceae bacterium]|nr:FlgO family outer membrane protein [Desulfuromonadaceae bacterium]MDD2848538.1 FlgO family outer membrane protein [Desulfuromonadaceae bacterium]MDD4131560.1 FlgO family outer membrane protein [Desulfuromonadaceae bacterium]